MLHKCSSTGLPTPTCPAKNRTLHFGEDNDFAAGKRKLAGGLGVFAKLKMTSLWRLNQASASVLNFTVTSVRCNRHTLWLSKYSVSSTLICFMLNVH